jgi:hypothetical protein
VAAGLGLQQYEKAFSENKIDAAVLPELTAEDLREVGVNFVGDRRKLLAAIAQYQDFGASQVFDCIDFGLPTTFPPGRQGIEKFLGKMLGHFFSLPADAVVVECAGDVVSASAPELLRCLKARRSELKITLAAADALGAMGAKHALAELGLEISLITGPCTDTPVLRQRTEALCGISAINLASSPGHGTPSDLPDTAAASG